MASIQNCTYKSVSLLAGEKFILPPGAEIVAATNGLSDYTSTCAKPSSLEVPTCYKFRFSGADNDNSATENWEVDRNFAVKGIMIDNVYYPFYNGTAVVAGSAPATDFQAAMNSITALSGLFTTFSRDFYGSGGDNTGWTNIVKFTTIPSIGANLSFVISTRTEYQGAISGTSTVAYTKGEVC